MLKAITIENFKSFGEKQSLPLAPMTLMIGANASGKSNAIEAFRFLSFLAEGQKLSTIQHNIDDSNKFFRGSSRDLGHHGADTFALGCEVDDREWDHFYVRLKSIATGLIIEEEKIFSEHPNNTLYNIVGADAFSEEMDEEAIGIGLKYYPDGFLSSNSTSVMGNYRALVPLFTFYQDVATSGSKFETVDTLGFFRKLLMNVLFIDPIPVKMRSDSIPEKKLRNDCSNLAGVLQFLWGKEENRKLLLQFIQSLPEQNFTGLDFFKDRKGKYSFDLVETFGGEEHPYSAELLSDGTLRVLAVAAALLSAPEGSTVVIEEVDNGIHPSRAHELLSMMLEKAKQRNIRLLLTTHNPALMDALPDEALGDVVFSYRDPEQGDSRLVRLSDLDDYAGLVLQGPLGDLVTRGVVDRFIKNPVSPEEKKKKALEWVEQMRGIGE